MGGGAIGEPDWATPGASTGAAATTATTESVPTASSSANAPVARNRSGWVLRLLSLLNIGLCAMMCALGVLGLMGFSSAADLADAFVSVYMILFALLLFVYEMMWWIPIPFINISLRMNFGFFYGIIGKALYMIFIAFLTIGLEGDEDVTELRWATGISFLATGVLTIFLVMARPQLVQGYKPPSAGLGTADPSNNV